MATTPSGNVLYVVQSILSMFSLYFALSHIFLDEDKMSDGGGPCETMVINETPHASVEVQMLDSNNHGGNTGGVGNHVHYSKYRHSKVVQL